MGMKQADSGMAMSNQSVVQDDDFEIKKHWQQVGTGCQLQDVTISGE